MYHALNRGNLRAEIFKKEADYAAFESILHEGLEIHEVELSRYEPACLVDRAEQWRWLQQPEPDPTLLSPWPLPRLPGWVARVNESLTKEELDAVRLSAQRGRPLGNEDWVESIARRLNLESTMRPRGRPRVRFPKEEPNKEA